MRITILTSYIKFNFFFFLFLLNFSFVFGQCPTITNFNQTFCDSQNPTINSLGYIDTGGGISWYESATSTVALSTSLQLTSTTYFADNAAGNCGNRQAVVVTIFLAPGSDLGGLTICVVNNPNQATISSLAVSGNNIKWYTTSTGGLPLPNTTIILNGVVYYASQTNPNTGCETNRTPIVVTVKFRPPPPTGASQQLICNDPSSPPTLNSIVATNVNNWYATPTLGIALPISTLLVSGQTYYADSYDNPCNSATRLAVTVTLSQPNNAGLDRIKRICANQTATFGTLNLFSELGGTPQNSGTWTGPIPTTNGNIGTIDLSGLTVSGSPYVFTYTVANGACPQDVATVTINIDPTPTASFSINSTLICFQTSATLTFTGTPNATVTYSENGIIKTIVIEADGSTNSIQNYSASTVFILISVTAAGPTACLQNLSGQITLTVNPLPIAQIVKLISQPICIGQTNTITFTGNPGATVFYTIGSGSLQSIIIEADGNTNLTLTFAETTTISLVSITSSNAPFCESFLNSSVQINVTPSPLATVQLPVINPACSGETSIITFNGTENAVVTYLLNNGLPQTITLNNLGTNFITGNFTTSTTIKLVSIVTSGINPCSNLLTNEYTLVVKELPSATISAGSAGCSGDNKIIVITGTPNATVFFSINGQIQSVVLNSSGQYSFINAYFVTTIIQLVSVTTSGNLACTKIITDQTATILINPRPNAGESVTKIVCSNEGIQNLFNLLGPTAQAGGVWTNPNGLIGNGFFVPISDPVGVYTYTILGTDPCPDDFATVTIQLASAPNSGTGGSFNICTNDAPFDMFSLLGGSPQTGGTWSPALQSGTNIYTPGVDLGTIYIYTVSSDSSCPNAQSIITLQVTIGPNAGTSGTADFCSNSLPASLFSSLGGNPMPGGSWFPNLAGGIYNPAINNPGVYTYSFTGIGLCQSSSATVTVSENPVPSAGNNGSHTFCSNDSVSDLFLYLTGNPQVGGVWTPTLVSGTGFFDPSLDPAGMYTYTVGGGFCPISFAQVQVGILQAPNSGGGNNASLQLEACLNLSSINLFSGLDGTQSAGTWTDSNNNVVSNIVNPSLLGVGNYNFTYTVTGGNALCPSDSTIVQVIVDPIPDAGSFIQIASICNSGGNLDLFSMLTGNQTGGVWKDVLGQTVTNILDLSTLNEGIHVYTYTITNSCGTNSESIQFTLFNNPIINSSNIGVVSPNCQGQNLTFNFTNMVDGNYTVALEISGSNVAPVQTIPIIIIGGNGNFSLSNTFYPNLGTSIFTFSNITNTVSNCQVTLSSITKTVLINAISDLADVNIAAPTKCFGEQVSVSITNATNLLDGNYQFVYSIPNGVGLPYVGTSSLTFISNGSGIFSIPAAAFPSFGTYQIIITQILNLTDGCNNVSENATTSVLLKKSPNINGAEIIANTSCINISNSVLISNATNLVGLYTINYAINGTLIGSAQITFVDGVGNFVIPQSLLTTSGPAILSILDIIDQVTSCGLIGTSFLPITFDVYGLETPILSPTGNQFCDRDNPKILNLNSNIIGTDPVIWYDAPTLGTVYSSDTLLINGVTYYATFRNASGCESNPRLAITVDLSFCNELLIPDGFSPNDDSVNDEFVIKNLTLKYPNFKLEIYNRYGNGVYFGNASTPNWKGTTNQNGVKIGNEKLPVGVYFYILDYNDGQKEPKQGRVYLSR
jgi:mucin-2